MQNMEKEHLLDIEQKSASHLAANERSTSFETQLRDTSTQLKMGQKTIESLKADFAVKDTKIGDSHQKEQQCEDDRHQEEPPKTIL